jgi:Leucine-rich repeat (LRR) protein
MKKCYTLLLVGFTFINSNAQIIAIPDANFKTKLLAANTTNAIARDILGNSMKIDVNNDNEIQTTEALSVYQLRVMSSNIADLSGIEYFTNLINLDCEINQITNLNVSALTNIQTFGCSNNLLTSLDVSNLDQLSFFTCRYNQLTTLNLGIISSLGAIDCGNNQLTSLDLSHNIGLTSLQCTGNLLTTLDLSGLTAITYLFCSNNQLNTLNVSNQSDLQLLYCNNNPPLTSLYIKNGSIEGTLNFSSNPNLTYVCADGAQITDVQNLAAGYGYTNCTVDATCVLNTTELENKVNYVLYPNPADKTLSIESNGTKINSMEIYNLLGQIVITIRNMESVSTIDVSNLKSGTYFIKVNTDKGTTITKFIKN